MNYTNPEIKTTFIKAVQNMFFHSSMKSSFLLIKSKMKSYLSKILFRLKNVIYEKIIHSYF